MFDMEALDRIVKETLKAIEQSKAQIYDIAENTRLEMVRVRQELEQVKEEMNGIIKEVDELEVLEKKARLRLVEVSRDFNKYTEKDIKEAYEKAYSLQVELVKRREKEKLLRYRRDHLEVSLKRLESTAQRAEKLVSQIGVVFNFLSGALQDLNTVIGELQQTQALAVSIIKAQEEERQRVAREIHDGPAQSLANIVMRAEFCKKLLDKDPEKVPGELASLQEAARNSLTEIRKIIFDLRPMLLDDLGLVPALQRYIGVYKEQYGVNVEFIFIGEQKRLEGPVEIALFRMVQEALTNVRKHSRASHALVKVELHDKKVNIVVRDDGVGFNLEKAPLAEGSRGYGLVGMKERALLLGGNFFISSAPGKGTTVSISIPIEQ